MIGLLLSVRLSVRMYIYVTLLTKCIVAERYMLQQK